MKQLSSTRPGFTPAISLWQPWATLTMTPVGAPTFDYRCAKCGGSFSLPLGMTCDDHRPVRPTAIKRYETRPRRAPSTIVGRRVLIHAAARRPSSEQCVCGRWLDWAEDQWVCPGCGDEYAPVPWSASTDTTDATREPVPLGALVGTAVIGEPLPIRDDCSMDRHVCQIAGRLTHHEDLVCGGESDTEFDITDQVPYGDWTPGRWAWPLYDPQPLPEPILWRGSQGVHYVPDDAWMEA